MTKYQLSKQAEKDIVEIFDYIAQDSKEAAKQVVRQIQQTGRMLCDLPTIGRSIYNLDVPNIRIIPVRKFSNYVVVYMYTEDTIFIVRILNGKRDIPTILALEFVEQLYTTTNIERLGRLMLGLIYIIYATLSQ